ncbi:MAG: A/G-specific adenine glycosylase [Bdellovibrionales bacterium]|nr:A/G-specific adenine glycosylase [Bdellovibrionales bacterium]
MPKRKTQTIDQPTGNAVAASRVLKLQRWYLAQARDLPWRRDGESTDGKPGQHLYSIWLSEIMLQQTQVATVIPYYLKFKSKFPRVEDLAAATIDEVYAQWAGLGYYSRARNLHKGAQAIAARLRDGRGWPSTRVEWLAVPGVGPYTAGAICSIGLLQREPIVDGNVVRVLSRLDRIAAIDAKMSEIWSRARVLVESRGARPRDLNQALMELGATVCRPKNPSCLLCPVSVVCEGRDDPLSYPPAKKKAVVRAVSEKRFVVLRKVKASFEVLLAQNDESSQWRAGLWDFPSTAPRGQGSARLVSEFTSRYQVTVHKVSREHQVLLVGGRAGTCAKSAADGTWFALNALPGVPATVRKALEKVRHEKI